MIKFLLAFISNLHNGLVLECLITTFSYKRTFWKLMTYFLVGFPISKTVLHFNILWFVTILCSDSNNINNSVFRNMWFRCNGIWCSTCSKKYLWRGWLLNSWESLSFCLRENLSVRSRQSGSMLSSPSNNANRDSQHNLYCWSDDMSK